MSPRTLPDASDHQFARRYDTGSVFEVSSYLPTSLTIQANGEKCHLLRKTKIDLRYRIWLSKYRWRFDSRAMAMHIAYCRRRESTAPFGFDGNFLALLEELKKCWRRGRKITLIWWDDAVKQFTGKHSRSHLDGTVRDAWLGQ